VRHLWLGIVLVIGACDHKPAPKQQQAAAAPTPAPASATVTAPAPAPAPAPTPTPTPAPGDDSAQACMEIGVRAANILVANAPDAQAKAQFEQARTDIVRATAQSCMKNKWDAELRQCFLSAASQAQFDACSARAPGAAASKPTRGS